FHSWRSQSRLDPSRAGRDRYLWNQRDRPRVFPKCCALVGSLQRAAREPPRSFHGGLTRREPSASPRPRASRSTKFGLVWAHRAQAYREELARFEPRRPLVDNSESLLKLVS